MGGGGNNGPSVPNVGVPSLGSLANSAISANIENLPRLLQAFAQYGPQYAQSINDIFGQSQSRLKELFPEQFGVMQGLSKGLTDSLGFLNDAGGMGLPQNLTQYAQNQLRSAQAARGMADSPAGAFEEANALAPLAENYRQSIYGGAQDFLNGRQLTAPGSLQSLDTLGLTPISNSELFSGAFAQTQMDMENQYKQFEYQQQAYNNQRKHRQNMFKNMLQGGIVGFAGGGPWGALGGAGLAAVGTNF